MNACYRWLRLGVLLCLLCGWAAAPTPPGRVLAGSPLPPADRDTLEGAGVPAAILVPDAPSVDLTVGSAPCTYATVVAAVAAANPGDRLLLEGGVTFGVHLTLQKNLTFQGGYGGCGSGSTQPTTLDGGGTDRVMYIYENLNITLNDLIIANGATTGNGAGVFVRWNSHVTGNNVTIRDNAASIVGGGMRLYGGRATLTNSRIYGNTAQSGAGVHGEAVNGYGPVLTLSSTDVYDNEALSGDGLGGGVYLREGTFSGASGSDVYGNNALVGGGLHLQDSVLTFSGEIRNNSAGTQGGGLYAETSVITLTGALVGGKGVQPANDVSTGYLGAGMVLSATQAVLSNTVVASNTFSSGAGFGGGIVAFSGSVVTLTNGSSVTNHHAPNAYIIGGAGGGIVLQNSTVTLDNSHVLSNTADYNGAGIYMIETSALKLQNGATMANNHALNSAGGAIAATGAPDIRLSDFTLINNSAGTDGGAIYLDAGTLAFGGGWTMRENSAGRHGGGIAAVGTAAVQLRAERYSFAYFNRARGGHGGMIYLTSGETAQLRATSGHAMYVYANNATGNGGALYSEGGGLFDIYGQVGFHSNTASSGGAVYVAGGSRIWLDDYYDIRPQLWENRATTGSGGAIYAQDSPRVECDGATFGQATKGNRASVSGGAAYLSGSTLNTDNCLFVENRAVSNGGAIAAYTSTLVIGATYPTVALAGERASERESLGAQAVLATACDPRTETCSAFTGNVADSDVDDAGDGGAIYSNDSTLNLALTVLQRNRANDGGALYQAGASASAVVSNTLVYSNTVGQPLGAGIRSIGGAFNLTHVTIANNTGGGGFSGAASEVHNTIAWGNDRAGFTLAPAIAVCVIDQSGNAGAILDPRFMSPGAGENYRLSSASPAIDACVAGLLTDLDNRIRPIGSSYDMGAYEYEEFRVYLPLALR